MLLRILAGLHLLSWVALITLIGIKAPASSLAAFVVLTLFFSGLLLSLDILLVPTPENRTP